VKHAAANNGLLYTAQGYVGIGRSLATLLVTATGTWTSVLLAACICSLGAGILAKFVVAPMRVRLLAQHTPLATAAAAEPQGFKTLTT
jgi:OFA family oxalate/formate antiporter-like MFS transporter